MKSAEAIFEKIEISIFFLYDLLLILRVARKRKEKIKAWDICRGTLGIECEGDRPIGLGATLGDGLKIKNNFHSFRDFSGESR